MLFIVSSMGTLVMRSRPTLRAIKLTGTLQWLYASQKAILCKTILTM